MAVSSVRSRGSCVPEFMVGMRECLTANAPLTSAAQSLVIDWTLGFGNGDLPMTPLRFRPLLKRIRWGGTRLGSVLGKLLVSESDFAESWELCDHGSDQSVVDAQAAHSP